MATARKFPEINKKDTSGERDPRFIVAKPTKRDKFYADTFPDHSHTGMTPHRHGEGWEERT